MTRDTIARWEARETEMSRLRSTVDTAALIGEFIDDLQSLDASESPVTLSEASKRIGYSADHLARLIRGGRLRNHGRKDAPSVRISECPRKTTLAQ